MGAAAREIGGFRLLRRSIQKGIFRDTERLTPLALPLRHDRFCFCGLFSGSFRGGEASLCCVDSRCNSIGQDAGALIDIVGPCIEVANELGHAVVDILVDLFDLAKSDR